MRGTPKQYRLDKAGVSRAALVLGARSEPGARDFRAQITGLPPAAAVRPVASATRAVFGSKYPGPLLRSLRAGNGVGKKHACPVGDDRS